MEGVLVTMRAAEFFNQLKFREIFVSETKEKGVIYNSSYRITPFILK